MSPVWTPVITSSNTSWQWEGEATLTPFGRRFFEQLFRMPVPAKAAHKRKYRRRRP